MSEARQNRTSNLIIRATLDRERALADRRQAARRLEDLRHAIRKAEATEARVRQHDGVHDALGALAEARVDVAAERDVLEIRPGRAQHREAAQ